MNLPTKLFHYSSAPIKELREDFHVEYKEIGLPYSKPRGLWISIEDYGSQDINWRTWCEDQDFRLEYLKYRYAVSLKKEARILHLASVQELECFSVIFQNENLSSILKNHDGYIWSIDWESLRQIYDGIFISPYQHKCRLLNPNTQWYYGWDCSSGCIWNIKMIDSFVLDSVTEPCQTVGSVKD